MTGKSVKEWLEQKFQEKAYNIPEFLWPTISPSYAVSTKEKKRVNILILNMAKELKEDRSILSLKKNDSWDKECAPATPTQYYSGKRSLSEDDLVKSNFEWNLKSKFLNEDSKKKGEGTFLSECVEYLKKYELKRDKVIPLENVIFHNFFVRPMKNGFNDQMKKILPMGKIEEAFKENGVDNKDLDKSQKLLQYILDKAKPDIVVVPGLDLRTWLSDKLKEYFRHTNFIPLPYSYFEIAVFKNDNDIKNYLLRDSLQMLFSIHMDSCQKEDDKQKWETELNKTIISIKEGEKKFHDEIIEYQYDDFPLVTLLRYESAMTGVISYLSYKKIIDMTYSGWVPGLKNFLTRIHDSVNFIIDNNVPKPPTKKEQKQTKNARKVVEKNRRFQHKRKAK